MQHLSRLKKPFFAVKARFLGSALVVVGLLTAACAFADAVPSASSSSNAAKSDAAKPDSVKPDAVKLEVVARVGGQAILRSELEASLESELKQLEMQRHQLLEAGLTRLVEERLLALEAASRGLDLAKFLETEVSSKVAITDSEVDAFYEANKARIGQPKEQIAGQIRDYLGQQQSQRLRQDLLTGLEGRYPVATLLEPWRVALGDPSNAPTLGGEDAPVTLTIFSDFQCPACQRIEPALAEVRESYGDRLRVVFRHYPLTSIHPQAFQAAEASLCAKDQGHFWQMHDSLFADQRSLGRGDLERRATELGLDAAAFTACLDKGEKKAVVERDMRLGGEIGVNSTPSLFVNGRPLVLRQAPVEEISAVIDQELSRAGS